MKSVGKIVSILNDDYVLVRSDLVLDPAEDLIVFARVRDPRITDVTGLGEVHIPKGRIRIASRQEGDIYLAATSTTKTVTKTVYKNDPFTATTAFRTALLGRGEQVTETVPSERHAAVERSQSLGISVPLAVTLGDDVARSEA